MVNRGNRGRRLFADAGDRAAFLETLAAAVGKTGWQVLAFCLAPDHFQLVIETPRANLVSGMKWLLSVFTGDHHRRHGKGGQLFHGRYRALLVQPGDGPWVGQVIDFVHLTPARERLISRRTPLRDFEPSSLPVLLGPASVRPSWLQVERALREAGVPRLGLDDTGAYAARLERLRKGPAPLEWRRIRRGWCFGSDAFKDSLARRLSSPEPAGHDRDTSRETRLAQAERIIVEELAALGWNEGKLRESPKMAPEKARIASRLRRETVLTLPWIARRLHMGSVNTIRNLLAELRRREAEAAAAAEPWIEEFDVRWD